MKILILRSVTTNSSKDDYSICMDTNSAERVIGHLSNEKGFCSACGNECMDCRKSYNLTFSNNIVGIIDFPSVVPAIIEHPEKFLPDHIPGHDVLLVISVNEEIIISFIKKFPQSKGIIIPIEESNWISPHAMEQITEICAGNNTEVSFPKPFCAFHPAQRILCDFKKHFRIGKPEVKFIIKKNRIVDTEVISSAPCGATHYTAQGLRGKSLDDNLEYLIDKLLSCYPCTGSTMLDNDFQDSIIHQAVKIQRGILYNIKEKI